MSGLWRAGWQKDEALIRHVARDFEPAIQHMTGGRLHRMRLGPCGSEGCVFFGAHPHKGRVALKVGFRPPRMPEWQQTDFDVAAIAQGERLAGVADVHGVWQSPRTGAYAVLRERVHTDWPQFRQERGISARTLYAGFDALGVVGRAVAHGCYVGEPSKATRRDTGLIRRAGLAPVARGIRALARRGACVGFDMHPLNLGWRRDARGRPEAVILDMGFSARRPGSRPPALPALAGHRC